MKILYVEDDPNDIELTINALNKSDGTFSITAVQKYKEALKLLSGPDSKEYDLVLADKNLPDGSGLELLAAVRSAEIPVAFVLITGQGDENSAGAALKSGSDDYIIKQKDYLKHLSTTLIKAQTEHKNRLNQLNKNIHLLFIQNSKADENLIIKHVRDHAPYIHMTFVEFAIEVLKKINSLEFSKSVDVILLDFNLPEMSALEFLTEFKQKSVVDIPVVIVGEPGNEENVVRALKSGASDFLVKTPGYLMRLPTIIENVINLSQLKKEKEALSKSEERYRIAFKNGLDAQYIATLEDGLIIETNRNLNYFKICSLFFFC